MDIKQTIEKHGLEFFNELLDIAIITNFKLPRDFWYGFALRHKLIKRTTKVIRPTCVKSDNYFYYVEGTYGRQREPQVQYKFLLKNGRGDYVLNVSFTQNQLEEWLNETNPNQTESAPINQQ